jgi:cyclopropane fatty-acyl-phospholipid synthase-like methyltransferase
MSASIYRLLRSGWRLLPPGVRELEPVRRLTQPLAGTFREHNQGVYHADYFDTDVEPAALTASRVIAESVVRDLAPASLVDLGCGTGALIAGLAARGVSVVGLEYSDAGIERTRGRGVEVHRFDVRHDSVAAYGRFDVALSTEVAEHIPERFADRLVRGLVKLGRTVVFTAATPGQGGTDHVNEQPHEYWLEKFAATGYAFDSQLSARWRDEWSRAGIQHWYWKNVMVFSGRE